MSKFVLFGFGTGESLKITVLKEEHTVDFLHLNDYDKLHNYDGVILNKDLIESFEKTGSGYTKINVNRPLLLSLEKILNKVMKDKNTWWCFLTQNLYSELQSGPRSYEDIKDTDILKKAILPYRLSFHVSEKGINSFKVHAQEFDRYFDKLYAIAHTIFSKSDNTSNDAQINSLASTQDKERILAFEINAKIFCLPFYSKTFKYQIEDYKELTEIIINSIYEYRSKRSYSIPESITNFFTFKEESSLISQLQELEAKQISVQTKLNLIQKYKAITTLNGDLLHKVIAEILEGFWGLNIDIQEECPDTREKVEDILILSEDKETEVLALIEVKGVNSGIKLEYINQVSTHRERNLLPPKLPGVLIINTLINKPLEERLNVSLSTNVDHHAIHNNTLILTTLELLQLMVDHEYSSIKDRKTFLLNLLQTKNGFFQRDSI